MKVKIGNTWYDSSEVDICIQVSAHEQDLIAKLDREIATQGKIAFFSDTDTRTRLDKLEWMNT